MQRRLALLDVDHVERPLRRLRYQKPEDLFVPESRAVVQGRLASLVNGE